ncbi:TPA: hypothetical protein N0F65_012810 [Lagenidium giganteum]|uniref:Uncharacterized protein n=1 Tax=Lagenidium giganteum TaxID=4803 RepID=A0AAV2YE74_9STRA|nr:TPA: hypothetical protein N0F65_012810 [Lagenidium giganteum]
MSMNVQLHEDTVPYLVSPYGHVIFLIQGVKLTVESGNGYPGQGGCFYGQPGRCYVSQYRIVYVSDAPQTAYKSFSIPFYTIKSWQFHVGLLGKKVWRGNVNPIPGGGLVGVGLFTLQFMTHGFDEFRSHVEPLLAQSRSLHEQLAALQTPSVLMVPAKIADPSEGKVPLAYFAPEDPFTIFIISSAGKKKEAKEAK